ncbi:MAG: helix-turn-helix transcriptional regulator [Candidatus Enteromonas sp.]|jgi:transcriptional regulator with XRE-family HTH domain|nr:helix-turn-helix transcriptional regulator [Bacilli bacterium]MCR5514182.1 helix-turn-helix domain-containing protein [Bacilli bacterium]MEE3402174.1 helix-turn-helix transcriptional regulator [Candidatus Enteromonas sp.]
MANKNDVLWQLGRRIAFLRKEKGLSQVELAADADMAKSYLSELELGKRNASVLVLSRLAAALGTTLEELFKGVVSIETLLQ